MTEVPQSNPAVLQEGDQAPAITLPTDSDGTFTLSEAIGNPVVLYFYPKDDTPGCTKEAIAFTQLAADFEHLKTPVIGISPDTAAKHDKFKAKHELTVTLAADIDKEICQAYGVWVEKNMYGKKYMGVERSTFLIDKTGKIAKIWRKVRVPGHAENVLKEVKALQHA